MHRLILTCRADAHEGEVKLAWANGVPEEGQFDSLSPALGANLSACFRQLGGPHRTNTQTTNPHSRKIRNRATLIAAIINSTTASGSPLPSFFPKTGYAANKVRE
jgi:hypothetical protein